MCTEHKDYIEYLKINGCIPLDMQTYSNSHILGYLKS